MAAPLLVIDHLRVDFPGVVAVNDLSLTVEAGDLCGLIGPNGAGKTTTMRAISGLQECTRGSVWVGGHELAREPVTLRRHLGYMPDFCPVYDQLTAAEFLEHFARAHAVPDRERRIGECLELTWLTEKRDALCEELSRGMRQRLVLAKTLLPDPEVLLLDEPASGLDPLGRIELWKILRQLREAGKAVLISSHILAELAMFCNKAAIMERGRLVTAGSIADLGRQLTRRRRAVQWHGEAAKPVQTLGGAAGVANLVVEGTGATFDFAGPPEALADLLRTLVTEGVPVAEWRSDGDELEQIFLQSGARQPT